MDVQDILRDSPPLRLVALALMRRGKVALVLAGPDGWHENSSYVFMSAALPGVMLESTADLAATLDTLALDAFGQTAQVVSSRRVYGPSAAHAIDRLAADPDERPVPLLRLERGTLFESSRGSGLRRVELRTYLARLDGEPVAASGAAGILWVAPAALRSVLRGMPFAEVLALPGVEWAPAAAVAVPDEAFVYVPADYGERHLVRIAAKYGPAALFQDGTER